LWYTTGTFSVPFFWSSFAKKNKYLYQRVLVVDHVALPLQDAVVAAGAAGSHPRAPVEVLPPLHLSGVQPRDHLVHDGLYLGVSPEDDLVLLLVDRVAGRTGRLAVLEVSQDAAPAEDVVAVREGGGVDEVAAAQRARQHVVQLFDEDLPRGLFRACHLGTIGNGDVKK
jgi:hypothetical protein